jgi:uncharacterized membrane protein
LGSIIFIATSFTTFLLYGTNNLQGYGAQRGFILFVTIFGILFALIKIIIFFLFNKDLFADLERNDRLKVEKAKNILSNPLWFLPLSCIATLFAFVNLNKNFILLRTLHFEGTLASAVTPKIITYFIIMMLPLIILAIVMNLIKIKLEERSRKSAYSDHHLGKWKFHNHRVFNVVVSILVIALSLLLIYA